MFEEEEAENDSPEETVEEETEPEYVFEGKKDLKARLDMADRVTECSWVLLYKKVILNFKVSHIYSGLKKSPYG